MNIGISTLKKVFHSKKVLKIKFFIDERSVVSKLKAHKDTKQRQTSKEATMAKKKKAKKKAAKKKTAKKKKK